AQDNAFLQTVIVGAINLVFTFVAIGLVDNSGRKPLLLFGTAAQTIAHLLIGYLFLKNTGGLALLIAVLSFVAAFAMAMGPVSWIVNSEIFPNKLRGRAMSVSIFLLWFADWVVTQTFPMLQESIGPAKTLEEIEAFWRKNKK
ncbi:MAG: MFS transporter, partial [Verrucomicrobiae bacterium]|nr:MFS transporter [Verrucomicrobiae bacterium]